MQSQPQKPFKCGRIYLSYSAIKMPNASVYELSLGASYPNKFLLNVMVITLFLNFNDAKVQRIFEIATK